MKISVTETGEKYTFYAKFPEDKTDRVHRAFNRSIEPNGLFKSADDYMNVTTSLQDNTNFAIKASPGMIEITIKREGNSPASYDRVKDICANIKESLKD